MAARLALCLALLATLAISAAVAAPRGLLQGNSDGKGNGKEKEAKCQVGACPFMQQKQGKGKAPCKACPEGTYTPTAGACCMACDGILSRNDAASTASCRTCPGGSVFVQKGKSQPGTCGE
jgi:hypothetical protein